VGRRKNLQYMIVYNSLQLEFEYYYHITCSFRDILDNNYSIYNYKYIKKIILIFKNLNWGLGIGDWGVEIGY